MVDRRAVISMATDWHKARNCVIALASGDLAVFELVSMLITLFVVWLALLAVHYDCSRHQRHAVDSDVTKC